jgi:hypothetical protein
MWNRLLAGIFPHGSRMDKDTRLGIISILEVSREAMKGASEARLLTLQIHEALVKARVPGYLEAFESHCENLFSQLTGLKSKLAHVVDSGIQALKENCTR